MLQKSNGHLIYVLGNREIIHNDILKDIYFYFDFTKLQNYRLKKFSLSKELKWHLLPKLDMT
jgi:hypothetical protein